MSGEKILVVDDNQNIRSIFTTAFDDYNFLTASSAKEALEILKRPHDIDLIVLDVMMPDMNGLELLKEIKGLNKKAKVMIMTGYGTKDIAIEALRSQADEFIEKPFDIVAVRDLFEKMFRQNRDFATSQYPQAGGNKVHFAKRMLERNFNKQFSLQDISKEVFLNYKYLSRSFKEKTGKSFNEYKLDLKLKAAKELLIKSSFTVNEIAYQVGYRNPNSFMKMFKKLTNLTPSEFRINGQKDGQKKNCKKNKYEDAIV
ncbi:MAG: response regulator [Candidatus Omnitrophica bacterium]|nr:response regulator [Candidatus Omnitrophota bacterium]